jgi:hypothetical protein
MVLSETLGLWLSLIVREGIGYVRRLACVRHGPDFGGCYFPSKSRVSRARWSPREMVSRENGLQPETLKLLVVSKNLSSFRLRHPIRIGDTYVRFTSNVRLFFQAKGYMEDGDLNHAQIGPSLQFNTRPLESLKRTTIFDMDDIKCMPVVFTIGYRYLPSTTQPVRDDLIRATLSDKLENFDFSYP